MNSPFATLKALLSAGLLAAVCLVARAQSGSEQPILFSTPDGQSVSNALLPVTSAPQTPHELPSLPDAQSDFTFTPPQQRMPFPRPIIVPPKKYQDDSHMGMETPDQVMGVPTVRELFGLPDKTTNSTSQYGDDNTNSFSSDDAASGEDANWGKILSADSDAFAAAKAADSNSLASGFFDRDNGDSLSDSMFHDKKADEKKSDDDFNNPSLAQANSRQPVWDVAVQIAAPATTPAYVPNATPAPSAFTASPFNSQSPFALPKISTPSTTLPQLPTVPSVSAQSTPSRPATPSWAPKPPPWVDPVPPLGTMAQQKF